MGNHYSFRLRHANADLQYLCKKIPLKIARINRHNDQRTDGHNAPLEGRYIGSYCVFKFDKKIDCMKDAIAKIAQIFDELEIDLQRDYPGLKKSIYCTIDGVGEVIDASCLKTLYDLDVFLEID